MKSLESITARIAELIKQARDCDFEVASSIMAVRDTFFPDNNLAWLAWTRDSFGFSRRHTFRLARVAQYIAGLPPAAVKLVPPKSVDFSVWDIIAAIPHQRLKDFFTKHPISTMDRDDVRDAVNRYMQRPAREQQQMDFFARLKLPAPEDFMEMVEKAGSAINPDRAASYGCILLQAAARQKDALTKEDLRELISNMCTILSEATGVNAHNLLKPFIKGS